MRQWPKKEYIDTNQLPFRKQLVFLDTDIGDDIDDALALALMLNSPEIELLGVSTVSGDTALRARLAAHLLYIYGREDTPVAAGMSMPLQFHHQPSGVPQAALLDPRTTYPALSTLSGPELLIEKALAHYGELTLICIGPLTNIATALAMQPNLFMAIRRIIMMGGTGGIPLPEWNVRSDAKAARRVLASGIPITMIGLNVTLRCQLREEDIARFRCDTSPQFQLLSRLISVWQRHRPRWHSPLPYLHDPLTVTALCCPDLLRFEEMPVRVLRGPLAGFMIPRLMNGPFVSAAVDIQADRARAWIMDRLASPLHAQLP